ncbi:MAG TPA: tripartite tricarboxylate transporter substrate binding protein [Burkholderiaceae bacterium]|jgi:tripartite-type tricarboxylate transporter receptor subunit TctC
MNHFRAIRRSLLLAALAAALPALPLTASAQAYPSQPIKLIVPFTPAGATDIVARMTATHVAQLTGWSFVIENRAGATGNIGMEATAQARPDGYTIAMGQTANLAINPALFAKMPFDPLKDFAPVAMVASVPVVVVVRGDGPIKTLADVVAAAKANPGKLTQALAGNGTVGHLAGELFARRAGVKFTNVPYKGAAPALTDLMGGQTDLMFATPQAVVSLIKSGKVRALAVSSAKRITVLPSVPTIAESGYAGFEAVDWKALVAPAGTPPAIVKTLNEAVNQALGQPSTLAELLADGSAPMGGTPEQAAQKIRAEHARWGALIREAGIKLD